MAYIKKDNFLRNLIIRQRLSSCQYRLNKEFEGLKVSDNTV